LTHRITSTAGSWVPGECQLARWLAHDPNAISPRIHSSKKASQPCVDFIRFGEIGDLVF